MHETNPEKVKLGMVSLCLFKLSNCKKKGLVLDLDEYIAVDSENMMPEEITVLKIFSEINEAFAFVESTNGSYDKPDQVKM